MKRLTVVVPTFAREPLLLWNLRELAKQTLRPDLFEVIVVSDGLEFSDWFVDSLGTVPGTYQLSFYVQEKAGPAAARNIGAREATGDVLLFLGDDCISDRNLLWRHYAMHTLANAPIAVQGYTEWHPDIPPDDFMKFLTGPSGIQANWGSLKNADGSWKKEAPNWFMTTNCSVDRREFEVEGGFCERFPYAAWEDIELSFRFAKRGLKTLFCPDAINYHYHKITFDSYIQRQVLEGKSRLILAEEHPEISGGLIDPNNLRSLEDAILPNAIEQAKDTEFLKGSDIGDLREKRWLFALQVASLVGIKQGIEQRPRYWQAVKHVHTEEALRYVVMICSALDKGETTYAHFPMAWAIQSHKDNWALLALSAEVSLAYGDKDRARMYIEEAMKIGVNEYWPAEILKDCT